MAVVMVGGTAANSVKERGARPRLYRPKRPDSSAKINKIQAFKRFFCFFKSFIWPAPMHSGSKAQTLRWPKPWVRRPKLCVRKKEPPQNLLVHANRDLNQSSVNPVSWQPHQGKPSIQSFSHVSLGKHKHQTVMNSKLPRYNFGNYGSISCRKT